MPAELDGVDELLDALARVQRDLERDRTAPRAGGEAVLRGARRRVPVATGELARSGELIVTNGEAVVSFGGPFIDHAGPAHYGSFDRPQGGFIVGVPFLDDASIVEEDAVVAAWEETVDRYLGLAGLA